EDLAPMVPRAGRAAGLVAGPGRRGRVAVVRRLLSALREARAPPATRELPGGRSSSVRGGAHRLKGRQAASNGIEPQPLECHSVLGVPQLTTHDHKWKVGEEFRQMGDVRVYRV